MRHLATTIVLAAAAANALVAAASAGSDARRFLIVRPAQPSQRIALHSYPGGPVRVRLARTTIFGSPVALSVAQVRGTWLGVRTDRLPNGRLGWIDARRVALRTFSTRLRIEVDLSRRQLFLRRGDNVVTRIPVAVGRPGSSTPIGHFAVTDKLPGGRVGAAYGCCVIALTAHQTRLPAGWPGGDRIAIHVGAPSSIGRAVSSGCLRARSSDLLVLMKVVPLGTRVDIHP
jgi:hypothetical protein